MHCLVVDRRPAHGDRLARQLRARACVHRVTSVADPVEVPRVIGRADVDVVFVEAGAAGLAGVELGWLRRLRAAPAIVLVSAGPHRGTGSPADGTAGYLSEPTGSDELTSCLRWAAASRRLGGTPCGAAVDGSPPTPVGPVIAVAVGRSLKLIPRSSVRWAEARRDYVRLHTADGSYLVRARLGALADSWRACGLLRIHRSYLVRVQLIAGFQAVRPGRFVVVVDGHRLPVARSYLPRVRDRLRVPG
jgi:DNA-binding LytR/AlgR family response regulator